MSLACLGEQASFSGVSWRRLFKTVIILTCSPSWVLEMYLFSLVTLRHSHSVNGKGHMIWQVASVQLPCCVFSSWIRSVAPWIEWFLVPPRTCCNIAVLTPSSEDLCSNDIFLKKIYLIEGNLLYRILFSVKPQHESAIGIHISPPFWTSFPTPSPFHPSRLIQSSPCLSFPSHIANSYWLSILHMVM